MLFQTSHYNSNLGTAGHRISSAATTASAASSVQARASSGAAAGSNVQPPYFLSNPSTNFPPSQYCQPEVQKQQQPPQDATVNGGISSVLDYELPTMSAFLSWCAFGMLKQTRNPTKEFESLLVSVLFATRLPKSTIIIALEYLNQRYSPKYFEHLNELEIFLKLVIALILANKFNDDNTFTNKSWFGATGLAVEILNLEERLWLEEVQWQLNVVNFESNIMTLEECWATWLSKYNQQTRLASSPISVNSLSPQMPTYSYSPVSSPLYSPSVDLTYHNQIYAAAFQQSQYPIYQQPQQQQAQQYAPPVFYNGKVITGALPPAVVPATASQPAVALPIQNMVPIAQPVQYVGQPPYSKTRAKLKLSQSYIPSLQSSPVYDSDSGRQHSSSSPFIMSSPVSMYDNAPTWSSSSSQFSKNIWANNTSSGVSAPMLPYGNSAVIGGPQPPMHYQHQLEAQTSFAIAPVAPTNGYPHNFVGYTNPFYYNVASC